MKKKPKKRGPLAGVRTKDLVRSLREDFAARARTDKALDAARPRKLR